MIMEWKKARYAKIPCYFNEETRDIVGRNLFYDLLISIVLWIDINIARVEGFVIEIDE